MRGGTVTLDELQRGQAYLNKKAADALKVHAGDPMVVYAGAKPVRMHIRDVVRFNGAMTADTAMLLPLREAQRLYGKPGLVKGIAVSNRGSGDAAVARSDAVVRTLKPVVTPLGLETSTVKADAIDMADKAGNAFMSMFTTFGTFSIAAGILLIFLIFVMLATERRGELGIARAVGTRRGHLVQMFTFEGAAYDLIAAAVGAILGALVAYAMVLGIASAFGAADEDVAPGRNTRSRSRSLFVAFAIGGLLTLLVVAFSAWRVSVMTISTAIRNLPEPQVPHRRRRLVLALTGIGLGALLTASGAGSASATALMLGISLILIGLVPILRLIGVSERLAYTSCGLAIAVAMLLPWSVWESVFGQISMDYSTWIISGLMTVIGTVWVLVYNADIILRAVSYVLSRFGSAAPVAKMAITYPLRARFRTGATLAMFTLVVFTLVTGTASSGSFQKALANADQFGGGFQVRAGTSATAPIENMQAALRQGARHRPGELHRGREPVRPLGEGAPARTGRTAESYVGTRPRQVVPRTHDIRPRRDRARLRVRRGGLACAGGPPRPCRRGRDRRTAQGQLQLRGAPGLPAQRLQLRGRRFRSHPALDPRPADRAPAPPDGDRHPERRGPARDGRDLQLAGHVPARVPGTVRPDDPLLRA